MREGLRTYAPGGHFLHTVVADGRCGAKASLDVTVVDNPALRGGMSPHAGKAVSLKLHADG